jgi:hypothetical protein
MEETISNEVRGRRRKLHNEELHNFYYALNIIRLITFWKMRWAGHMEFMEEKRIDIYKNGKTRKKLTIDSWS